ncbi:MAG: phenylalanine--tRNA ligase subunit beta [Deltaproteobacteria bacterium]|nr:phenylalanine--tRNA ligase subunit beta [Deltaproteobacteria bacterium]
MFLSLQWLREFVPYEGGVQELADRLTMLGLEVEEIVNPFARLTGFVVGHVVECRTHPSSDHLSLCTVDLGRAETVQIVCGAPNVAKGQKVPVAPVGVVMPNGLAIKKAKLRGEVSEGMICSQAEMEIGPDSGGIMVLSGTLKPGQSLAEALGLETEVLDVSITPNRGDCLSILGLAREVAMAFGLPLRIPQAGLQEDPTDCRNLVEVIIDEPGLCPVYQGRCVHGVVVAQSPDWLRFRLLAVGVRPISNVVDVTNYILMELGQPLHAFDHDLIEGGRIRVARAPEGLRFTTLDGQERTLQSTDLLIWDGVRPVALAGVMGGANSEISGQSRNILLESAVFNPSCIRKTARRLSLPSEASYRFERGVDQPGSRLALDRAAAMMAELTGGRVLSGVVQDEPRPFVRRSIRFRPERARSVLALDVSDDYCLEKLEALGCESRGAHPEGGKSLLAPSHRLDLEREADLVEEVGRVYGLDRIPTRLPQVSRNLDQLPEIDRSFQFESQVKDWALGCGLSEAITYSFVGSAQLDALGIEDEGRVRIMNPLSEDMDVLRLEIVPGLLNALAVNMRQGQNRVRLFEVAHVFREDLNSDTATAENNRLGIVLVGNRFRGGYPFPDQELDYTDIKGLVDHFLARFRIGPCVFKALSDHQYLLPGVHCLTQDGNTVGLLGRLRPEASKGADARSDVWFADLDLDVVRKLYDRTGVHYQAIPRFPHAWRDSTIMAGPGLQIEAILQQVRSMDITILENVSFVDSFVPEGSRERHLTFRMVYRHPERTLKDKEVDKAQSSIVQNLVKNLGVRFS